MTEHNCFRSTMQTWSGPRPRLGATAHSTTVVSRGSTRRLGISPNRFPTQIQRCLIS